jgi:hypothetical protein
VFAQPVRLGARAIRCKGSNEIYLRPEKLSRLLSNTQLLVSIKTAHAQTTTRETPVLKLGFFLHMNDSLRAFFGDTPECLKIHS